MGVVAEINADSPDFDHLAPMVDAAQQDLAEHKEASQAAPGLALGPQLLFQPASSTVGVSVSGSGLGDEVVRIVVELRRRSFWVERSDGNGLGDLLTDLVLGGDE